jgi:hypothetical protein
MRKICLLLPLILLVGCFGRTPKVIIVESDNVPYQIIDEKPIQVRCQDTSTKDTVEKSVSLGGYYVLSPSLYRKLVSTASEVLEKTEKPK